MANTMSCESFFTAITWFGSLYFLLPSSLLLSLALIRTGKWREVLLLGLSLSITVLAVHAAKLFFRRPRPQATELLVPMPTDWSFPSAHTAQATAFFLVITIIACRWLPPVWAGFITAGCILMVISIGWSRVFLQVHYLSDVLAGGFLAALLVVTVHFILSHLHTIPRP